VGDVERAMTAMRSALATGLRSDLAHLPDRDKPPAEISAFRSSSCNATL